jgi:hypothetical protein
VLIFTEFLLPAEPLCFFPEGGCLQDRKYMVFRRDSD